MSERIVALIPVGKKTNKKNDCTAMMNSSPMMGHAATKNSFVNPSGPETLSFGKACRADLISSPKTGATSPVDSTSITPISK